MKYLGIVTDDKFKFSQHISHAADKCAKLIFSFSKSAKIHWGLKHEAYEERCYCSYYTVHQFG